MSLEQPVGSKRLRCSKDSTSYRGFRAEAASNFVDPTIDYLENKVRPKKTIHFLARLK